MKIAYRFGTIAVGLAAALAACRGSSATEHTPPAPAPAAEAVAPAPMKNLDTRTPVPLTAMMANHQKQEMRDHLRVVQEITAALAADDFDAIAKSAARIGWSDQAAMMCKHMGAGAPGFAETGEHFHRTADTIAEAARHHDRAGVGRALGATLQTCVGCHDSFRQEIVDGAALPSGGAAGRAQVPSSGMDPSCPMMHGK
jgi:cytochrome c556